MVEKKGKERKKEAGRVRREGDRWKGEEGKQGDGNLFSK